jgi:hypothetical protein
MGRKKTLITRTPWPESVKELYRLSDRDFNKQLVKVKGEVHPESGGNILAETFVTT